MIMIIARYPGSIEASACSAPQDEELAVNLTKTCNT